MEKLIDLKPVIQTGHNCKTTAIAAVDQYYADKHKFEAIPLHKKKTAPISIRALSKTIGSQQGELLEIRQFPEIFAKLGYDTKLIDFDNLISFQANVTNNIKQGNLVIACFAVNQNPRDRNAGQPSTIYDEKNEHAAILHGFDEASDRLDMTHWDQRRKTTMKDFFQSSMELPRERKPEIYVNIKHKDKEKKYDLHSDQTGKNPPNDCKISIIPKINSGFRAKLIVIKDPGNKGTSTFITARRSLKLDAFFTKLKLKTNELIKKNAQSQKVKEIAILLNNQLDEAKKQFSEGRKDFDQFKQACNEAIVNAEPEFKQHRGWHQVSRILRGILGILAGLTIIPGIMVAAGVKQGYSLKDPLIFNDKKLI